MRLNGLFMKQFLFTVFIIISVSAVLTVTVVRMSEQFFIDRFSITNSKVMNQVKDSFESFHYSIVNTSNEVLQNGAVKRILSDRETEYEQMISYFNMYQQMNRITSYLDAYEVGIVVTGKNGMDYATDRPYWPITDEELRRSAIRKNTLRNPKRLLYQYDYRPGREIELDDRNFIVASRAIREPISGRDFGELYFAIQEKEFRKFYASYTSPGNHVFVTNKSGVIFSSSRSDLIGRTSADLRRYTEELKGTEPYKVGDFMGKDHIILMEYLPSFDLYLFNIIDKEVAFGDLVDKSDIAQIVILIVIIILFIVFFASRRLTNSLSTLASQISGAAKHDFVQYVTVGGTYETKKIAHAFNSMLDELHDYVEELMQTQKEKRNAELAALQQQINPHFLYNTLTSIRFMVQQGGRQEAENTIMALISLLQNTIGSPSETVTVKRELENLKNYAFINQKRYGDRIKTNYFVSPDCLEELIPNLILQPFMENAFFHAFNRKDGGYINVLIWKENGSLICEVVDNGDGMEVEEDKQMPAKSKQQLFTGIGVRNVHERLQLIYGDDAGVSISSKAGDGTTIRLTIPLSKT